MPKNEEIKKEQGWQNKLLDEAVFFQAKGYVQ
jgi:hypothetical protein